MLLLAVDPGRHAGWALWSDEKRDGVLVRSETINGDDAHQAYDLLTALRPSMVVVEEQHSGTIRKGRGPDGGPVAVRMPWASLRTLIRRADIWSVCAELLGIQVQTVNPATWQAFFRLPRGRCKEAIQAIARRWAQNVKPDEADAILIGKRAVMLGAKP